MWNRLVVWLACYALKRSTLTLTQRNHLVVHTLDTIDALPLRDIVTSSDEGIFINGKPIDIEKLRVLRGAAQVALNNQAFNLIGEQVRYLASERLLHKVTAPEDLYYYRAAIWFVEQMKAHLQRLAGSQELPL